MRERVCKNCGGREYRVVGQNMVKCKFCGTLYVDEHASKEEEVLVIGANEILRTMRFEDAEEEFDKILGLYPLSFEAHFGKALAKNKIIIYKKGASKRPRFFDKMVSISEEPEFKRAVELAPPEMNYQAVAKRIDKIKKNYEEDFAEKNYDCMICAPHEDENAQKVANELQANGATVFVLPQRDKEEETFRALETAKALLIFASNKEISDFKFVWDRYLYFIQKRRKTRTSLIVVCSENSRLPKELSFCQKIDEAEENFVHDLVVLVQKEVANAVDEVAKIETVKVEKVEPTKKEYVDIESISPQEIGHYHVENINVSDETKIKWIFLSLKNGDFETARETIAVELEKDPYNSELLFAALMEEQKIKTQDEFFESINNFSDRSKIDEILRYANRQFAEFFVDNWERLIVKLDDVDIYCTYLIYLAGFKTPNREDFVKEAEEKAVETLDEQLISLVLQCFSANEVDRFINFYFLLAQKSDDKRYYEKILELDEGHVQSNIALLMQNFKSAKDILTYRDKEQIKETLKFFDDNSRLQFVTHVVNLILDVAYFDLEQAQSQLDFYLAYITSDAQLSMLAQKIATKLQEMKFFTVAEKYISIAISKDKENGTLYWDLILIKAHCRTDNELMTSSVKVTQMPEWETLLALSDDAKNDYYASVVSKGNLYKGERNAFAPDLCDKKQLTAKLQEFLLRNEKILLEAEKEKGDVGGVNYYKAQIEPFKKYITDLEDVDDFKKYCTIVSRIENRLQALDLTLDASLSTIKINDKAFEKVLPWVETESKEMSENSEKVRKKRFLGRFLCIFLELFPLLFTALLLVVTICAPKQVYLHFSQNFLIWSMMYSVLIALLNGAFYLIFKRKSSTKSKIVQLGLFCVGIVNLALFAVGFYLSPKTIVAENAKELQALMKNAYYSDLVIENDIDFGGKSWKAKNFYGTLDGNGHTISNVVLGSGGFIKTNGGEVKNFNLELKNSTYSSSLFGGIAKINKGSIENCSVTGTVVFRVSDEAVIGGLVGINEKGEITNCSCTLVISIQTSQDLTFGGLVGEDNSGKLFQNLANIQAGIALNSADDISVGGLVGNVAQSGSEIMQNVGLVDLEVSGSAEDAIIGGLFGVCRSATANNRCNGAISTGELENGYVGGLVGQLASASSDYGMSYSYAIVNIASNLTHGNLVGKLSGRIYGCFTIYGTEETLVGEISQSYSGIASNCKVLTGAFYDTALGFDETIWQTSDETYPLFLWEV